MEDLVDDVVQSYHNGFNKAIHNYSRILRLFSESKDQASLQIPPVVQADTQRSDPEGRSRYFTGQSDALAQQRIFTAYMMDAKLSQNECCWA